jgi:hypothetical protein
MRTKTFCILKASLHVLFLIYALVISSLGGCSIQKLAVRSTFSILENSMAALNEEDDLELAEMAIASNLKLLEGLIRTDPDNSELRLMAAEGYTSYALGFIEAESPGRASQFYLRAKEYGITILKRNREFAESY